jgi:hypothetical protein
LGDVNDEIKSEWPFWRAHRAGRITLDDYDTITYPKLAKINAILDMEDAYKLADEGKRAKADTLRKLKEDHSG